MPALSEHETGARRAPPPVGYPRRSSPATGALANAGRKVTPAIRSAAGPTADMRRELTQMTRSRLIERAARLRRFGARLEE